MSRRENDTLCFQTLKQHYFYFVTGKILSAVTHYIKSRSYRVNSPQFPQLGMSYILTSSAADATAFFHIFSIPSFRLVTFTVVMQAVISAEAGRCFWSIYVIGAA